MLLLSTQGVKPTGLLRETGNSDLEADPRVPPNQKNKALVSSHLLGNQEIVGLSPGFHYTEGALAGSLSKQVSVNV